MYKTDVEIDQNGGEYMGNCWITANESYEVEQTDYKTLKLTLREGIEVVLEFDERIVI